MTITKQLSRVIVLALAAIMALGAVAWACTPQTKLFIATPAGDRPRSTVTVSGEGVAPGQSVQILWNDVKGPKLAEATAAEKQAGGHSTGAFSVQVGVPDVPPGIYYILAVAGDTGVARLAFEVTPAPSASPQQALPSQTAGKAVSSELWTGFAQGSSTVARPGLFGVPADEPSNTAAIGFGMFSMGIAALGTAAGASVLRRRVSRNKS